MQGKWPSFGIGKSICQVFLLVHHGNNGVAINGGKTTKPQENLIKLGKTRGAPPAHYNVCPKQLFRHRSTHYLSLLWDKSAISLIFCQIGQTQSAKSRSCSDIAKYRFRQSLGIHTEVSSGLLPHGFPLMSVCARGCEFPLCWIPMRLVLFGQGSQWNLPQRGVPLLS